MATSMTRKETVEFLENSRTLVLSTLKRDGSPVMHALWFTYLDDAIYINIQLSKYLQMACLGIDLLRRGFQPVHPANLRLWGWN